MAVHNTEKYLSDAIESILNQTYSDFELIIVDDGSTDHSLEIIRQYEKSDPRIKVIVNEVNLGISKSRNKGLAAARGEYIANMDSDDICFKDRLEKQINYFKEYPDTLVLGGQIIKIDTEGHQIPCKWKFPPIHHRWDTLTKISAIVHGCMMAKTACIKAAGGYPEEYQNSVDRGLFQNMALSPKFCMRNVDDLLYKYRIHQKGTSQFYKDTQMKNSRDIRRTALEKIINKPISNEVIDVLYGHNKDHISLKLSRNSFQIFEDVLRNYRKMFHPSQEEWSYIKKDFVKRADNILGKHRNKNRLFISKLFFYNPKRYVNKAYRAYKSLINKLG